MDIPYTSDAKYLDSFDDDISMINPNNALRGAVWRDIYDRHLLIENSIRFHNISYSEDLLFNYEYLKLVNSKIGWTNRKYYFYRTHSNQTMQEIWLPYLKKYHRYYNSLKYAAIIVKNDLLLTAKDKQLNSYALSLLMNGILWGSIRFKEKPIKTIKDLKQSNIYLRDYSKNVTFGGG